MAITRTLYEINVTFAIGGDPVVRVSGIISDDVEGTITGKAVSMINPAVLAAAVTLRDAAMTVAANAGKPLTLP